MLKQKRKVKEDKMNIHKVIGNILFDKEGNVIGKYYGKCPICGKKRNLTFDRGDDWVCRKCYYGR